MHSQDEYHELVVTDVRRLEGFEERVVTAIIQGKCKKAAGAYRIHGEMFN